VMRTGIDGCAVSTAGVPLINPSIAAEWAPRCVGSHDPRGPGISPGAWRHGGVSADRAAFATMSGSSRAIAGKCGHHAAVKGVADFGCQRQPDRAVQPSAALCAAHGAAATARVVGKTA
jgi:hypothetical protein